MKKLISVLLLFLMVSNVVLADQSCDWSKIQPSADGTYYKYPEDLHICVGKLVEDNKAKDAQIQDLTKAIQLKDLALDMSDKRVQLWTNTSSQLEDRLTKIDSMERTNQWLYFGLGALTIIGAGLVTARLIGR